MIKGEKIKVCQGKKNLSSCKDEVYLWIFLIWVMMLNQYKLSGTPLS